MAKPDLVGDNQDLGARFSVEDPTDDVITADKVVPDGAIYGEPPHNSEGELVEEETE